MGRTALWLSMCLAWLAAPAHAADQAVIIDVPEHVRVDDRLTLVVSVHLPADAPQLVLVTPSSQGGALEVVKGRLLRADARDPGATPLVFDVPVVANEPGTAVVKIRVATYRCPQAACTPLDFSAERTVLVLPR